MNVKQEVRDKIDIKNNILLSVCPIMDICTSLRRCGEFYDNERIQISLSQLKKRRVIKNNRYISQIQTWRWWKIRTGKLRLQLNSLTIE